MAALIGTDVLPVDQVWGASMGQLLRIKRHTATGKQSQVLIAAVNRHMPATPASGNRLRINDAYFATV